MTPVDVESELNKRVLQLRIIICALLSGIVALATVAIFVRMQGQFKNAMPSDVLLYVGLGFTACTGLAYVFVPESIVRATRRRIAHQPVSQAGNQSGAAQEWTRLCDLYVTQTIVSAALLEGTAFLWLIYFLMTGEWYMLTIGLAAALFIALKFPSTDGLSRWLSHQQEMIEHDRSTL